MQALAVVQASEVSPEVPEGCMTGSLPFGPEEYPAHKTKRMVNTECLGFPAALRVFGYFLRKKSVFNE